MKKFTAIIMVLALAVSIVSVSVSAVQSQANAQGAKADVSESSASGITVHYYTEKGTPNVYYWNSLPQNISTEYPGPAMTSEGSNWYSYTFPNVTKINMLFVDKDGTQSAELTRENSPQSEWFYKGNRWRKNRDDIVVDRTDLREDSIYFVITTRFYDGDKSNNVHCWDDGTANNPDTDTAWRGDFKGLIQRLDYIKALGFTAIWITPVVENASGYDYHGYHAMNFAKVDPRYESSDTDYQTLIDAAHEKGMKIIQDVVWNHSGNFGEAQLCPMFTKDYSNLASGDCMKVIPGSELDKSYPGYTGLKPGDQFQARLDIMKDLKNSGHDSKETYHRERNMGYGTELEQQGSMAGDCVDINTENPEVANYINDAYTQYVDMGVDSFRLDTEKHINRWTLNSAYFPAYSKYENFYIFGEVCARWSEFINEGGASDSPFFYTWAETESEWKGNWGTGFSSWSTNNELSKKHYQTHMFKSASQLEKSSNALLNGVEYHTPDYSKSNGTGVIDFTMHWNFYTAGGAFGTAQGEDPYFNDSTWNVTYVDSHDYAPNDCQDVRYNGGTSAWAENMDLMFTFRGIPCIYYGSEVEFKKGEKIDVGPNAPLSKTGRAYFGDYLEGSISASDFGKYTASGKVNETMNATLAQHVRKLNMIRRAVPALQKGQYTTSNVSGGNMAFTRRYKDGGVDSVACVAISGGATFNNLPNGRYVDAVTGDVKNVSGGTLSVSSIGQGNMRVYVLNGPGKIGDGSSYLK